MTIPPISHIPGIRPVEGLVGAEKPGGIGAGTGAPDAAGRAAGPFGEMFQSAVHEVARFHDQAALSADRFLQGEDEEIHQVALDAQRAELSFDLFLQTRNKVVEAYQEIMRMQL